MTIIQIILIICGAITVIAFLFAIIMSVNGHSFKEDFAEKLSKEVIFLYFCRKYIELCTISDCRTKRF